MLHINCFVKHQITGFEVPGVRCQERETKSRNLNTETYQRSNLKRSGSGEH